MSDYQTWTLDQIDRLNEARQQLHGATTADGRRAALRRMREIHEEAYAFNSERDASGPSVRSFPAGFSGGR